MTNLTSLRPIKEDKERLNQLLNEIGTIIARNNKDGLELDFDLWSETVFGPVTGYGREDQGETQEIPPVFLDAFQVVPPTGSVD